MAARQLDPPLVPRNGHTLEVLLIGRVSNPGPGRQDIRSLEDQEADHRKWLTDNCDFPFNITVIAGSGSGEWLDRKEVEQAQAELESGKYDLVKTEDLGRVLRRMHAYLFCETAEDVGTRVIALNDFLDSGRDDWRLCAVFAAMRHEMYNADTAKRIRRRLRNRFMTGGVFQTPIYGYIKPHLHATDSEVYKARDLDGCRDAALRDIDKDLEHVALEIANVTKFIRGGDDSPAIRADLGLLEIEQRQYLERRDQLKRIPTHSVVLPTAPELRQLAADSFQYLAQESFEFAKLMRILIPKIVVFPYRRCDGGHIVLRARFRLQLTNLLTDERAREVLWTPLEKLFTGDLFRPTQRAEHRQKIVAKRAKINPATGKPFTERTAARELSIPLATAQQGAAIHRTMTELGIDDPYVPLLAPPDDYGRLRRHKNARYHFEPLNDAGQF